MSAPAVVVPRRQILIQDRWTYSVPGEYGAVHALEALRAAGPPSDQPHSAEHWLLVCTHAVCRVFNCNWHKMLDDYFMEYGWPAKQS